MIHSEFDHVAARQRRLVGDDGRSAFKHMPGCILLHVRIFRRHAVDRHDDLVAALCRAAAGADDHTLRGSAANDDRLDSSRLQPLIEAGAEILVRSALEDPLAVARRDPRVDNIGRSGIVPTDQAIEHHRAGGAGRVMELLDVRNCGGAARAFGAVGFHHIENQERRCLAVERDRLELGHRRGFHRRLFGNNVRSNRRRCREQRNCQRASDGGRAAKEG